MTSILKINRSYETKQLDMYQELLDMEKEHISNHRNKKIQSLKCITHHLQK